MLDNFFKNTYLFFNKIKVIHNIPGRLRISVPNLNKIPNEFKEYEKYVSSIIMSKKGIKEINYSYLTNKMLIKYESDIITVDEIMAWLNLIFKTVIENRSLYEGLNSIEILKNADKFYEMLSKKLES